MIREISLRGRTVKDKIKVVRKRQKVLLLSTKHDGAGVIIIVKNIF